MSPRRPSVPSRRPLGRGVQHVPVRQRKRALLKGRFRRHRCVVTSWASFLKIPCFQVRCGRRPCRLQAPPPAADAAAPSCPGGHECIQHPFLTCFTPPCHQWGVCSTPDPPTPLNTQCEPNSGYLDNSCARITLIFKKDKVPKVRSTPELMKTQDVTFRSVTLAG